jgi:predicted dehydrogenase
MKELVGRTDLDAVIVERIQEAARGAGKQVMVGFMKRDASAYRLAKRVMTNPSSVWLPQSS